MKIDSKKPLNAIFMLGGRTEVYLREREGLIEFGCSADEGPWLRVKTPVDVSAALRRLADDITIALANYKGTL